MTPDAATAVATGVTSRAMTPRGFALFLVVSVVWGVPYLLIAVALRDGIGPVTRGDMARTTVPGRWLRLESRHADWRGSPFTAESPAHVSVYRLASPAAA